MTEPDFKEHIAITGPQRAPEVGSCNACTRYTAGMGGRLVYDVQLRSLSFRLCPGCLKVLSLRLLTLQVEDGFPSVHDDWTGEEARDG